MITALAVDRSDDPENPRTTEAEMVRVESDGNVVRLILDDGVTLDLDACELRKALAA